jgi:hypothetical protein
VWWSVDFLIAFTACQRHLVGVNDDNIVAIIHMGREGWLMLASQAKGDQRRQAANNGAGSVYENPFFIDFGRFRRISLRIMI